MKQETIHLNGKEQSLCYEIVEGKLWIHLAGQTYDFESAKRKSSRSGGGAKSEPGVVRAQMPGKILKIHVEPGQKVQPGDPTVAMEAMKMEYVLKADIAGTIAEVNCSVDEQVGLGTVLIRIEGE